MIHRTGPDWDFGRVRSKAGMTVDVAFSQLVFFELRPLTVIEEVTPVSLKLTVPELGRWLRITYEADSHEEMGPLIAATGYAMHRFGVEGNAERCYQALADTDYVVGDLPEYTGLSPAVEVAAVITGMSDHLQLLRKVMRRDWCAKGVVQELATLLIDPSPEAKRSILEGFAGLT